MMKRVALYARVSTDRGAQTTENQLRELQAVAVRLGWTVVAVYTDEGISGTKGRDQRPGFDALLKGVARKEYDMIAAWSVDRLGRSLQDLVSFLADVQARGVDLYLHQQAIDTSTPSGRMLFQLLGVFAEFERAMIRSRVVAGLDRVRGKKRLGRPPMPTSVSSRSRRCWQVGKGVRETARATSRDGDVQRLKRGDGRREECPGQRCRIKKDPETMPPGHRGSGQPHPEHHRAGHIRKGEDDRCPSVRNTGPTTVVDTDTPIDRFIGKFRHLHLDNEREEVVVGKASRFHATVNKDVQKVRSLGTDFILRDHVPNFGLRRGWVHHAALRLKVPE
jgi:DNA invertase Pin-like site-specific DNA recombinase